MHTCACTHIHAKCILAVQKMRDVWKKYEEYPVEDSHLNLMSWPKFYPEKRQFNFRV